MTCWVIFYLEGRFFWSYFRTMSNPSQKAICSSRNKSQMAPNGKVLLHEKLGLRSKHRVQIRFFRRNQVFAESMKERGSMYEHFPLCGSAWAAIWGRLVKKEFSDKKSGFRKVYVFCFVCFWGCFLVFPKRVWRICNRFGSESWRKMMRRGQVSILSNQIN